MQVHYQHTTFGSYSIKKWTGDLTRIVFALSALCSLIKSAAVCPSGRMPPDCQSECRLGYFGNDCAFLCPTSCMNRACQPDTGFCYRCQLGFTGPNCSHTCHRGFFGQDCNNTCSTGCFRKQCDPFTGLCEKCVPGYEGLRCETHYLFRNHANLSSSSLPHGDMSSKKQQNTAHFNTFIYIAAAVFSCMMLACSVALCSNLVKLKTRQERLNQFPIYRKHSLNVLSPSFLRRPGATAAHEYIEMKTIDADCDTTDVKPNIAANILPDSSIMDVGKCPESTRNFRKHLFTLPKTVGIVRRADRSLPMLANDTEAFEINLDDIYTHELSNILKRNTPLRVKQAANYSRELYFKSYLPSQRFPSGIDDPRDNVRDQQELSRSFLSGDQLGPLSLVGEKKTEADTIDMEVIDESRKPIVKSTTSRWYSSRSNSPFVIDESDMMTKDTSQKSPVIFNLTRDLLQNGKHHTQPGQLPDGNCPRGEDSSSARESPRNYNQTVNTDVTALPEKNDHASLPEVTDGHRSKVYAETTEPLLNSSRLLWRARKSLTTIIHRAVKSWTGDIYEQVSEDQRRAVEKLEFTNSEITNMQPELERQEVPGQSEFPCNCLDCELQTEERKFDLEFTCHSFQSQTKERYKDVAVLGVADSAGDSQDETTYPQQVACATVHCNDDSGINKYNVGTPSGLVNYKDPFSNTECQTNADVINDISYTTLPKEYVKRLISGPVHDVHNGRNDNGRGKNSYNVSQDFGMSTLPATTSNHLSSKPSLVDDAPNNFSFCCVSKNSRLRDYSKSDQAGHNDIPLVSVSCSELMSQLSKECNSHHIHNSYTTSYSQQSFYSTGEVCTMHTSRSDRRPLSHTSSNREKDNVSDICETTLQNSTSLNYFSEERTADLDTLSVEAFPKAGVILLSTLQAKIKQKFQTNTHIKNEDNINIPEKSDSFIPETERNTNVARRYKNEDLIEDSQENYDFESGIRNNCKTPVQSSQTVDENPQGSNIGSDLSDHVSLIPKSVISLTVRQQPNREIKPVYDGDIDLQLSRCTSREKPQPEEKQRQKET